MKHATKVAVGRSKPKKVTTKRAPAKKGAKRKTKRRVKKDFW
jgi:hypothetical protein